MDLQDLCHLALVFLWAYQLEDRIYAMHERNGVSERAELLHCKIRLPARQLTGHRVYIVEHSQQPRLTRYVYDRFGNSAPFAQRAIRLGVIHL